MRRDRKSVSYPFSEIYHLPYMIRDPRDRGAGQTSDYFASTHDVGPTLLSAAGVRVPGGIDGEDSHRFSSARAVPDHPTVTASYGDQVLAGDDDWFLIADNRGERKRIYRREDESDEVSADNGEVVDRLWDTIVDHAGGPPSRFRPKGVVGP